MASDGLGRWRVNFTTFLWLFSLGIALWLAIQNIHLIFEVIWILFGATLITLAVRPLANYLTRWHVPRGVTAFIVYAGVGGILFALGNLLRPAVNSEIAFFQSNGANLVQKAVTQLHSLAFIGTWLSNNTNLAQNLTQRLDSLVTPLIGAIANIGNVALDVILSLVIAYFFIAESRLDFAQLLDRWLPVDYQSRSHALLAQISVQLTRWVWAQAAIALYFAVVFGAGLALVGVPFALTIGLVGGVLEIVPYLGGAIALTLGLLSALATNPTLMIWVAVLYIATVEIESHLIAPMFYGRVIGMHPAAVLVALFVGFKVGGVIGVLLAVPVAVILISLVRASGSAEIRTG